MDQSYQDEIDRLKKILEEKEALIARQEHIINTQNGELSQNLMLEKKIREIEKLYQNLELEHQVIKTENKELKKFQKRVLNHPIIKTTGLFKNV